jgi:hypothetical protein
MLAVFGKKEQKKSISRTGRVEELLKVLDRYNQMINRIMDRLYDDRACHLAREAILRTLRFVWFLPASETYHLAKDFGLFEHLLNVAVHQLENFDRKMLSETSSRFNRNRSDGVKTRQMKPLWQYAFFLHGLLHDVGKVYDVLVWSGDMQNVWQPFVEPLYDFCKKYNHRVEFKFLPDRDYAIHKRVAPAMAMNIIVPEDIAYMGRNVFSELIDGLSHYTHKSSRFYEDKRTSDMTSTEEEVKDESSSVPPETTVFEEIRRRILEGSVPVNVTTGPVWVSEKYVAVNYAFFKETTSRLRSAGTVLPPDGRILKFLADRKYIRNENNKQVYEIRVSSDPRGKMGVMSYKALLFRRKILLADRDIPLFSGYLQIDE